MLHSTQRNTIHNKQYLAENPLIKIPSDSDFNSSNENTSERFQEEVTTHEDEHLTHQTRYLREQWEGKCALSRAEAFEKRKKEFFSKGFMKQFEDDASPPNNRTAVNRAATNSTATYADTIVQQAVSASIYVLESIGSLLSSLATGGYSLFSTLSSASMFLLKFPFLLYQCLKAQGYPVPPASLAITIGDVENVTANILGNDTAILIGKNCTQLNEYFQQHPTFLSRVGILPEGCPYNVLAGVTNVVAHVIAGGANIAMIALDWRKSKAYLEDLRVLQKYVADLKQLQQEGDVDYSEKIKEFKKQIRLQKLLVATSVLSTIRCCVALLLSNMGHGLSMATTDVDPHASFVLEDMSIVVATGHCFLGGLILIVESIITGKLKADLLDEARGHDSATPDKTYKNYSKRIRHCTYTRASATTMDGSLTLASAVFYKKLKEHPIYYLFSMLGYTGAVISILASLVQLHFSTKREKHYNQLKEAQKTDEDQDLLSSDAADSIPLQQMSLQQYPA